MATRKSEVDHRNREKHVDTENLKHRFGGPGKSPREGHLDPQDSGNKPGQEQAGQGREPRRPRESRNLLGDRR